MEQPSASERIQRMYDLQPEREWQRAERHRTEFALTLRALEQTLPPAPARVLDCGGGPGRYAIALTQRGYQVTLFDLSAGCLELARIQAAATGVALAGTEQGSATDLSRFSDQTFDAVLLMGPLYHLLEASERQQALAEAYRVLRPGGGLFAAFITRYAPLRWAAANDPSYPMQCPEEARQILDSGMLPPRGQSETEFVAYFARPEEVSPLCREAGFEVVTVLGVEGLVSQIEEGINALSGEAWPLWVDLNWEAAADPTIHGCTEHLLVIGRRPRWRAVLSRIVRALHEADLAYKVVGGASAALQGVPIAVQDLDFETDPAGAYRFQELFSDHVTTPVALREGGGYRSHFGRFDVEGITVEVMGDLHRREAEGWVPTWTTTERTVDLDGLAVRVSWLEEETLAYLRRGRLERAACCLPRCEANRLTTLLKEKTRAGVL